MPTYQPPETGTLVIAALLILTLAFSGYWISSYVTSSGRPWALLPWFFLAAGVIIAVGFLAYWRGGRTRNGK
jgi:hypothetical protein